jgi:hypothetical protein
VVGLRPRLVPIGTEDGPQQGRVADGRCLRLEGEHAVAEVAAAVLPVSLRTAGTAVPNRGNWTFPRSLSGSQLAGLGWVHRDESSMGVVINPGGPMKRSAVWSALATGLAAVAIAGVGSLVAVGRTRERTTAHRGIRLAQRRSPLRPALLGPHGWIGFCPSCRVGRRAPGRQAWRRSRDHHRAEAACLTCVDVRRDDRRSADRSGYRSALASCSMCARRV